MTREEAIERVKTMRWEHATNKDNPDHEAMTMAIKALEQEPCDDCVSIQAVNEILLKYAHSEEGKLFTEFLISQIKDLPPVLPKRKQGKWIYTPEKHIVDETDEEIVYATENRCSCSACGHKYGFYKMSDAYCRYCGAEMAESEEENE